MLQAWEEESWAEVMFMLRRPKVYWSVFKLLKLGRLDPSSPGLKNKWWADDERSSKSLKPHNFTFHTMHLGKIQFYIWSTFYLLIVFVCLSKSFCRCKVWTSCNNWRPLGSTFPLWLNPGAVILVHCCTTQKPQWQSRDHLVNYCHTPTPKKTTHQRRRAHPSPKNTQPHKKILTQLKNTHPHLCTKVVDMQ